VSDTEAIRGAETATRETAAGETAAGETAAIRRNGKSAAAFRTTGEVAEALDLPAYVLRFWESKFPQVQPLKRAGGRRYYRPQDIDLLRRIRQCLYQEGYTIRGVQKLLRDGALRADQPAPPPAEELSEPTEATEASRFADDPGAEPEGAAVSRAPSPQALREALEAVQRELLEIRVLLDRLMLPS
jgi:DNA-binding transcriptional MerR regulator